MDFVKKARRNLVIYNHGFHYSYIMGTNETTILKDALDNSTIFNNIKYLFANPSDAFVSLMAFPFDVYKFNYDNEVVGTTPVYLGDTLLKDGNNQDWYLPTIDFRVFMRLFGEVDITPKFNNFLDFNPYTKIELYLPFCEILTLDANVWMNEHLKIYLSIDFNTGQCTYYLYKEKNQVETLMMSVNGQCGFEIPLGATNRNEMAKQMLSIGLSNVGGLVESYMTNNPLKLLETINNASLQAFNNIQLRIQKGARVGGTQALMNPFEPYLIITTPKAQQIDYAHEKGRPLMKTMRLGDLVGFTRVTECHLDGFSIATSSELNELTNLLNDGIIL